MRWRDVLQLVAAVIPEISEEVTKREDEFMSHLWKDQLIKQSLNRWLDDISSRKKHSKSVVQADSFKNLGNKEFQAKRYAKSIDFYTKSMLYAPSNSSQLAIAFANRSASLFYLDRYEECIRDADLAIQFNYPKRLRYKLYLRTTQCYLKLGKRHLAEKMLFKLEEIINDPDYIDPSMRCNVEQKISDVKLIGPTCVQNILENDNNMSKLKFEIEFKENSYFPGASECIDMKYTEEAGRHVVANRFVKKGDVLFLEKPFSFVLRVDSLVNDLCGHCNRRVSDIPIPCTTCSDTLYCDEKCSNEAWSSYHRWECAGFQMGLCSDIGIGHLALKVLLICTTTTDRIRFNDVQNLCTNFDKLSTRDLKMYGTTAIMLTTYLSKYTNYFEENDIEDSLMVKFFRRPFGSSFNLSTDDDSRLYISCLLLRHVLQLINNGHAISRSDASLNAYALSMHEDIVATGIYPSASIMNHSCDPNIINIFVDQYLIVKASRDIALGEQVFNCYGPHYRYSKIRDRQQQLKHQYFFTCKCNACVQPKLQHFIERFEGSSMKCPECNGPLCDVDNLIYCLDCGNRSHNNLPEKMIRTKSMFLEAEISFRSGKLQDALNELKECLKLQRAVLYKYNENITVTLVFMAELYRTSERWIDSIKCLEDTIPAVTERFGPYGSETLNRLNNIVDECFSYFEKETNNTTYTYRNTLKRAENHLHKMEEIAYLLHGSWSKVYKDIKTKQKRILLLKNS